MSNLFFLLVKDKGYLEGYNKLFSKENKECLFLLCEEDLLSYASGSGLIKT